MFSLHGGVPLAYELVLLTSREWQTREQPLEWEAPQQLNDAKLAPGPKRQLQGICPHSSMGWQMGPQPNQQLQFGLGGLGSPQCCCFSRPPTRRVCAGIYIGV